MKLKAGPFLVIIDGPIGSGKTSASKILHSKLKRTALISLDRIKCLVSDYDNNHEDIDLASDIGTAMTKEYLRQGINVIVEKAFTRTQYLKKFITPFQRSKANILIYQLEAPLDIAIKRVKQRPISPDAKRKLTKKRIIQNHKNFMLYRYKKARVFDSTKSSPEEIAREMQKDIKNI